MKQKFLRGWRKLWQWLYLFRKTHLFSESQRAPAEHVAGCLATSWLSLGDTACFMGRRDLPVLWPSYCLVSVLPCVLLLVCHFPNLSAFSVFAMNWVGLICVIFKRQD